MVGRAVLSSEKPTKKIRVMVVSDDRLGASLLREALSRFAHCDVLYCSTSCEEAHAFAASTPLDVAIINVDLEKEASRGLHLARRLSGSFPALKAVLIVDSPDRHTIAEAFQSGVRGIFHQGEPIKSMWDCIRKVHSGQIYASDADIAHVVQALVDSPPLRLLSATGRQMLSSKEQLVARHVTEGYTNREIAEKLCLSEHTVKNYLFRIFDRLGVSSRAELILYILSRRVQGSESDAASESDSGGSSLSRWLKEAKEGSTLAQYRLGDAYLHGIGVPKDRIASYMWFTLAEDTAAATMEKARLAKEELAEAMTHAEIGEAQRRVSKRINNPCESTRGVEPEGAAAYAEASPRIRLEAADAALLTATGNA